MSNHGHAPHCSGCSCTPHLAVASHNRQPSPPRSPLERPHRIQMHCRVNKAHATTQHSVRPGSTQRAHGSDSGLTEHGLQLHGHRFVHPHHRRHVVIAHSLHPQRPQASQESAATPFFAFLRHQAAARPYQVTTVGAPLQGTNTDPRWRLPAQRLVAAPPVNGGAQNHARAHRPSTHCDLAGGSTQLMSSMPSCRA